MVVNTVTGGLVVEEGRRREATGRLTSWRSFAENAAALCAGPIGGWLVGMRFGAPAGISIALTVALFAIFAIVFREDSGHGANSLIGADTLLKPIKTLLKNRYVWISTALFCAYQIAPGFQTPLFFYQTDTLHFRPHFIGTLALVGAVGGMLGAAVYAWVCRRSPFRRLFSVAILGSVMVTLCYLAYGSATAAVVIETSNGFLETFAFVALLDLVARSLPEGQEALGYAFVFSIGNLASSASDILGSHLFDAGVTFNRLVWINASTTTLLLLAVPLLPVKLLREVDFERSED